MKNSYSKIKNIALLCYFVTTIASDLFAYNRGESVSYAHMYAYSYNPNYIYYPYSQLTHTGGDCTNFVSQCLRAGGIRFTSSDGQVDPKGCMIKASEMPLALLSSRHGGSTTGTLRKGDVGSFSVPAKQYFHSVLIVEPSPVILFAAHTGDRDNEPLIDYIAPPSYADLDDDNVMDDGEYPITVTYIYLPDYPIVKQVQLLQEQNIKYLAYHNYTTNKLVVTKKDPLAPGEVRVKIIFDTSMDTDLLPI